VGPLTLKVRVAVLTALACVLLPTDALARDWASAGGWDIGEFDAEHCGMGLEYEGEGETLLVLGLATDGSVLLTVTNYNWSTAADQTYNLVFYLNGTAYSGGKSLGFANAGRKGFATWFEPDFLKHFAASTYLTIKSEAGKVVDDLKLEGSAAGLAQVRRCVAHLRAVAAAEAREKARFAHIPQDPFAEIEGEPPPIASPAQSARGNVAALISADDYPADALRAREQGRVAFRLGIGTDGRVTSCEIVQSSGSRSLDSATCRVMRSRARYTPAKAADGKAVPSTAEESVTWSLGG
jgi:TonB family protein